MARRRRASVWALFIGALILLGAAVTRGQSTGDDTHDHRLFPCMEDGLKSNDTGCQVLGRMKVPQFPDTSLIWYLNRFPTRSAAEAAKVQNSLVAEAEGK